MNHDLLTAKLNAYGVDRDCYCAFYVLTLKTEMKEPKLIYRFFGEIVFGVPQGSIVRPLLFTVYICDMFYESRDWNIARHADNNTPYRSSQEGNDILKTFKKRTK